MVPDSVPIKPNSSKQQVGRPRPTSGYRVLWLKINRCGGDDRAGEARAPVHLRGWQHHQQRWRRWHCWKRRSGHRSRFGCRHFVVGVDSCLNDQCGLTFSNGPGVTGGFPSAIASNDIARAGSAAVVAGGSEPSGSGPRDGHRNSRRRRHHQDPEPGRCIDRVTGFQSSDVSDKTCGVPPMGSSVMVRL